MKFCDTILVHPHFSVKENKIYYLNDICLLDLSNFVREEFITNILYEEGIIFKKADVRSEIKGEHILVVETHLDDFSLSASGYVISELSKGVDCHVLNIFSKTDGKYFPWKDLISIDNEEYEKIRLSEAEFAIGELLGAKFSSLQMTSLNLKSEFPYVEITNNILDIVSKEKIGKILFPIGIFHRDHKATYIIAKSICSQLDNNIDIIFYEDYPYMQNKKAYIEAMSCLKQDFSFKEFYVTLNEFLDLAIDLIIAYRSQYNDLNRKQIRAIMCEIFKNTASEAGIVVETNRDVFLQRYFRVVK